MLDIFRRHLVTSTSNETDTGEIKRHNKTVSRVEKYNLKHRCRWIENEMEDD